MLIHDCNEMEDQTRYMGAAIVTLTEVIWAQARYLSSETITDRSEPGSQVGKGKVHHHIHGQLLCFHCGMCPQYDLQRKRASSY